MTPYRARSCPKCQHYVGYNVSKPVRGSPEAFVLSFCLNCNYQLPVRAVLRGKKNSPPRNKFRRPMGPTERGTDFHGAAALTGPVTARVGGAPSQPQNYPSELRAIGQQLEKRRFTTFNLKCSGNDYFVWSTENMAPSPSDHRGNNPGESGANGLFKNPDDPDLEMLLDRIVGFQYAAADVARLAREGMRNRRHDNGVTDGRRLSHLLRTVGEQVHRRHQRLLAIAWQAHQIGVVSESAQGRREMNVLSPDRLYDLWVRMYLRRSR